ADLYYRLNVLTLNLPPLRERASDIEALVYTMLEELAAQHGHAAHCTLTADALRLLAAHAWPGNVRELRNTLERALMLSDSAVIDARVLAPFVGIALPAGAAGPASGGLPEEPGGMREAGAFALDARGPDAGDAALADRAPSTMVAPATVSYAAAFADWERRFLSEALAASGGRVAEAAARIGIGRATLYKKIAALGLDA
ncbi:helix-turn-helix domain-containing protein, partial [Burkholderia gladioli]|nr:helix-turn-helix domain-containing protein [Burkholderia gladioli]